jgi:hypothetical protein
VHFNNECSAWISNPEGMFFYIYRRLVERLKKGLMKFTEMFKTSDRRLKTERKKFRIWINKQ